MRLFCTEQHPQPVEIDWTKPSVDPRITLIEALWKDEEWKTMTKRIARRIFPGAEDRSLRAELLHVLGGKSSEPKATAP